MEGGRERAQGGARPRSWRQYLRPAWIAPVLSLVLVIVAASAWWLARRSPSGVEARQRALAGAAKRAAVADLLGNLRVEPNPAAFVESYAGREDPEAIAALVHAYAAWASRGDALEARREIIERLLRHSNMKLGVEALLKAVALDTTPRRHDPLWRDLVEKVGGLWDTVTVPWGRDLFHIEGNPKSKDLILESLARASTQKVSPEQQHQLVTDLIDAYPTASPDQKPALNNAIAAMAGPDVVEILAGRGINRGSTPLASIEKINQELENNKRQYRKVLEQIEKEEREAQEANAREGSKATR